MSNDEIIDIKEAAKYLRIKERTLYGLVKQKKVPGIKIGGQWRFKKSQLDAMFAEEINVAGDSQRGDSGED